MVQKERKPQLIGNRFTAIVAVCLIGFIAARDFHAAFLGAAPKSSWLIDLHFLPLPSWALVIVNVAFFGFFLLLGLGFYRWAKGKERVVIGGWFASALLGLLVAPIAGELSPHTVAALRFVQGVSMAVAFVGALLILVKSPAFGKSDVLTVERLLLFLGAFIVILLAIGALIYFAF
jgi:hypothetical protein